MAVTIVFKRDMTHTSKRINEYWQMDYCQFADEIEPYIEQMREILMN